MLYSSSTGGEERNGINRRANSSWKDLKNSWNKRKSIIGKKRKDKLGNRTI